MEISAQERPKAIVVGSGAGGAAAALELQKNFNVTILEAGKEFRPLSMEPRWMDRLRDWGLLFDKRLVSLVFPAMRLRLAKDGLVIVNGRATGGTTVLSTGNGLRMDGELRKLGIDLDKEFEELAREIPASTGHMASWSEETRRLFELCKGKELSPSPVPKLVDQELCRNCGRCVLGCPNGAKWDSRRFLKEALSCGARLQIGKYVTEVVIQNGRAIGVHIGSGWRRKFISADLVVLAAGGLGTPDILARSGIVCEPRLFVDPVLCVAAPWPASRQRHELPMPFVIQRPGYMISPYFDYLSHLFNPVWKRNPGGVLSLMIKLADSETGTADSRRGRTDKGLSHRDRQRLAEAEALCRTILADFGADPTSIFTGTLNAGHPGGMIPLTVADAQSLHPARLPDGLYVADASLFPQSLGNPPILTILALARRTARAAAEAIQNHTPTIAG